MKHMFGMGTLAAVTAVPTTRNGRPFSVMRSPSPTRSASAYVRSSTMPPALIQWPEVSSGWSTAAAVGSRPSATTAASRPPARTTAEATG